MHTNKEKFGFGVVYRHPKQKDNIIFAILEKKALKTLSKESKSDINRSLKYQSVELWQK